MSDPPGTGLELLTPAEMAEADKLAVKLGVPSLTLMENAGRAVAEVAMAMVPAGSRIAVLCGPGNNGGDGFVAARLLAERGYQVDLCLAGDRASLKGDAAIMAGRYTGPVHKPEELALKPETYSLAIDAIFGAGFNRKLEGDPECMVGKMISFADSSGKVLAIDVPTGLDGSNGSVRTIVVQATHTVTFFRRKPGHLLMPGRLLCGKVTVADIGIPGQVLSDENIDFECIGCFANAPRLWLRDYPWPCLSAHKYDRGHALVVSGPAEQTGAARLGARAALRVGAGLVTVASPRAAFPVNSAHLTAIMVMPFEVPGGLANILADTRKNAVLIGPGAGVGAATREMVAMALAANAAVVLDADALTSFAEAPETLSKTIDEKECMRGHMPVVLTPHEGEFKRLFGDICPIGASKLDRARAAANASGAIVVLKGPDTVIAAPYGSVAINENAPPWLATAGSGDVLAGFITGLLAQGMSGFDAASAAVWLHGECANVFGPGLIAEDLPEVLPRVLAVLQKRNT